MIDFRKIALTDLAPNTGQIPGLPANPRGWTDSDIKRLAKSMKGASVNTSFLTNLEDRSVRLRSAPKLYAMVQEGVDEFTRTLRKSLPKYSYPPHIITSAWVGALSRLGIEFSVPVAESEGISGLDAQKEAGKAIFGKGYIVSDAVKAEREKAEREKAEREKAEREKAEREKAEREKAERWELSDRERAIVMRLNEQGRKATT